MNWIALGEAVVVAYLALAVLARLGRPAPRATPASSHQVLILVALLAGLFFLVPWVTGLHWPGLSAGGASAARAQGVGIGYVITSINDPVPAMGNGASAVTRSLSILFILIGAVWMFGVGLALVRGLRILLGLKRVLRASQPAPPRLSRACASLARQLGVTTQVRLLVSSAVAIPFVTNVRGTTIVLPDHMLLEEREDLELVMAHELTHVARRDPFWTAVTGTVLAFFPWHPSAKRLATELAFQREAAVDARVASGSPKRYALLLLDVAGHAQHGGLPLPVGMHDSLLSRRITRLAEERRTRGQSALPVAITAAALVGASLLASTAFPRSIQFRPPGGQAPTTPKAPPPDLLADYREQIRSCTHISADDARVRRSILVELIFRPDGRVVAAQFPIPEAPGTARCLEKAALGWTLSALPAVQHQQLNNARFRLYFSLELGP